MWQPRDKTDSFSGVDMFIMFIESTDSFLSTRSRLCFLVFDMLTLFIAHRGIKENVTSLVIAHMGHQSLGKVHGE